VRFAVLDLKDIAVGCRER